MPGSVHVSVLEAFDLPETIADGDNVAIKVAVGTREYQTVPSKAVGGKTAPWSLDFVFPVLNLRDNLVVTLLDENGEAMSKSEIDTPSIVEQGSSDVHLLLNGGGNVHLSLSFVLTEEERRRIDVMRAAALKRREQEALKIPASMQSLSPEGKAESRSFEHHATPAGSPDKNIEKVGVAVDSSAILSQEAEYAQSVPVSEAIHSLTCTEAKGQLDNVTSEEPETNLYGTSRDNENQEPSEIADLAVVDDSSQSAVDELVQRNFDTVDSSSIMETDIADQKLVDMDKGNTLQPALEAYKEMVDEPHNTNLKSTSSSVKARINAFEKTRPQGATKQNHILSPSSKIQKVSPHNKTSSRKKGDGDAERIAKVNEPLRDLEVKRRNNKPVEPAYQMKGAELHKSGSTGNEATSKPSEAGLTLKEENRLFEIPTRRSDDYGLQCVKDVDHVESNGRNFKNRTSMAGQKGFSSDAPAQSVDSVGIKDAKLRHQSGKAELSKRDENKSRSIQGSKNVNLVSLSKQVLSGAVSGAVFIAAVALLWAVNPKRRSSSLQQRNKQRKRK